ncbi:DBH-like monooxygenase protein 2 [Lissotriton helveticus]
MYYPKNDITVCLSIPVYNPVSSSLGFDITRYPNALNSIPWTTDNIALVQKKTKETLQYIEVFNSNQSFIDDFGYVRNISDPPNTSCTV